jgi:hypothetical protein
MHIHNQTYAALMISLSDWHHGGRLMLAAFWNLGL